MVCDILICLEVRMEYSNLPRGASLSRAEVKIGFMHRVYAWMCGGLLVTAATAWYVASDENVLYAVVGNKILFYGLIIAELGLVVWLSGMIGKMSAALASVLFTAYSLLNGVTLSVVLLVYTQESVATAFFTTAAMFGAMSAYGFVTKRSLDGLGAFCFMGLIGIVVASVVNIFLRSAMVEFVFSVAGVIVFTGLAAYDTRKLKMMAASVEGTGEMERVLAIRGALSLYLDFVNLFLMLLRIFGGRKD